MAFQFHFLFSLGLLNSQGSLSQDEAGVKNLARLLVFENAKLSLSN